MQSETILHGIMGLIWLSLATFVLVFAVQTGTKFYLGFEMSSLQNQIETLQQQVNKQTNAELKLRIKGINDIVNDYNSLSASGPKWSKLLKAFAPIPPAGVNISSFVVNSPGNIVTITGFAPTRDLVIELYNNLQQDTEHFSNVDYPLENVSRPADIQFHFTFSVKDNLLK